MQPPKAKQIPYEHRIHDDVRQDPYDWLKDSDNQEVIDYLEEENKYFKHKLSSLQAQSDQIFEQMVERIPESEEVVPVKRGPYFYYSRLEKEQQYEIYARKRAGRREDLDDAKEEIVLDVNTLSDPNNEEEYLNVTEQRISSDHKLLAYLENRDGTDRYTLFIKNLETGELLEDKIPNVYLFSSIEWSKDGKYIFYITLDDMQRPDKLWRHQLGTSIDTDELLYEEKDSTFTIFMEMTQSGKFISVISGSTMTTEVRLIDTEQPLEAPKLVDARKRGVIYFVEHWENDLIIVTNEDAINFKLLSASLGDFSEKQVLVEHDEKRYIQGVYPFKGVLFVYGRENGMTQIWRLEAGQLELVNWDEDIYTVYIIGDQSYDASEVLIGFYSLITPKTTYALDIGSGKKEVLQVAPVSGDYDKSNYVQKQLWVTAADGVEVPMMMLYHQDALKGGPAPLILEAYGSYGSNSNPFFSPYILPILDQGVVFVTVQIRGGSEMGRTWYEDGKMNKKMNSFTDFIAAADYLIDEGYTTANQLAARGGSAGGLLVGAVANMAGSKFKVIVPEVPFVDVVTTMLDDTLPLTTLEWDEWGNPQNEESYHYMKSYSPYDNVESKDYPHLYVTAGLNDPRVGYFEPAKWVARLREMKTDDNTIVLKTHMGAGHFGASGRINHLKEEAECYAFVLDKILTK
ncbi:S9 family peptidase [Aliicoccus persicus]|uniref:Oligopeptidase B n=1 Tax=Aliicoccus persicus TaxID=930138 RepID=A0A662Z4A4_9STAP|nr:S9 family peptidase [Aliicoccus persicus]SEV93419.1 oligopeptidase B [Aliicoccus persicus]